VVFLWPVLRGWPVTLGNRQRGQVYYHSTSGRSITFSRSTRYLGWRKIRPQCGEMNSKLLRDLPLHPQQRRNLFVPEQRQPFSLALRAEHGDAVGEFVAFDADVAATWVRVSSSTMCG
jgi:hypothetical protein